MSPDALAALYARAFPGRRGWSAEEIATLLDSPGVFLVTADRGFAIGRAVLDEVELVTICIDPSERGRGQGRALLAAFEAEAGHQGAAQVFLEVAADNAPAKGLYSSSGYAETGRRAGYYAREGTAAVDAVLMQKYLVSR